MANKVVLQEGLSVLERRVQDATAGKSVLQEELNLLKLEVQRVQLVYEHACHVNQELVAEAGARWHSAVWQLGLQKVAQLLHSQLGLVLSRRLAAWRARMRLHGCLQLTASCLRCHGADILIHAARNMASLSMARAAHAWNEHWRTCALAANRDSMRLELEALSAELANVASPSTPCQVRVSASRATHTGQPPTQVRVRGAVPLTQAGDSPVCVALEGTGADTGDTAVAELRRFNAQLVAAQGDLLKDFQDHHPHLEVDSTLQLATVVSQADPTLRTKQ